jgi:hypothetical protein
MLSDQNFAFLALFAEVAVIDLCAVACRQPRQHVNTNWSVDVITVLALLNAA